VTNLASTYLMREAISRHQQSNGHNCLGLHVLSRAVSSIRSNQKQSEAIRSNQRQSYAIRGNQGGKHVLSRPVSSARAFTRHNGSFTPQEVDALHHRHHRHIDRGVPEEGGNQRSS
jgi:hypothetical protein